MNFVTENEKKNIYCVGRGEHACDKNKIEKTVDIINQGGWQSSTTN